MKKKILSLLTAFAMVFGILVAPFTTASASDAKPKQDAPKTTNSVTLHKILQTKENLAKSNFPGKEGLDGTKYDGNAIDKIADYFGQDSEEINGVYFAWQKQFEEEDPDSKTDPKAKIKVWRYIDASGNKATVQDPKDAGFKAAVLGGLTGAQADDKTNPLAKGYRFDTSKLAAGQYRIQEIDSLSTYVKTYYFDKQGNELVKDKSGNFTKKEGGDAVDAKDVVVKESTLTGSKAVPVELTLPIANNNGVVENAHVYPKNTEDKPTTNKDFSDQFTNEQKGRDQGVEEESQTSNPTDKTNDQQDHNVGDVINYTVRTTIPKNARYASAYWDDNMTEGLTYNKDLSIKLNGKLLVPGVDYTLEDKTDNEGNVTGFKASLKEKTLKKINGQTTEQEIVLTYSATLNDTAVSKVPESNDVTFHFGNNPNKGNTPIPTKPNKNGELKVTKSWDDGVWADGEKATFRLVDAQTGKTVTKEDLVKPEGMADDAWTTAKNTFEAEVTIGYNQPNKEYTWKYLNKDKQYKAIEINMTTGTESEYVKQADGTIKVVNHKTNNPKSINPTEPKVKTESKKFVKRDEASSKRLAKAEFVVQSRLGDTSKGKYLKINDNPVNQTNVDKARTALKEKVDAYNNLTAEKQDGTEGATLLGEIETAQNTLNEAIKANVKYTWVEKVEDATVYTSNKDGQIEVKGLKDGDYTLVETKAPEGYSKTANVKKNFTIGSDDDLNDNYLPVEDAKEENKKAAKDAIRVNNTLVTIPETGGIGSLIFIVAGLAIMTGAFVAYKKSQAVEA